MASVNKVILVGNLGADPETRYMPGGDAICNFRIATTDKWKDKASGEWKESTEWHKCTSFGRLAEICNEYLKKGASVYVEGSLKTRKYQAQDGTDRYSTEIRLEKMQILSGGRQSDEGAARSAQRQPQERQGTKTGSAGRAPAYDDMEDPDIQF